MKLSQSITAMPLQARKGPSAQLHVHMGHSHSMQQMLHRAEVVNASTSHQETEKGAAVPNAAQVSEDRVESTGVRFDSTAGPPPAADNAEPCSKSLSSPVWTTIDLPLPLDTQDMADVRCSTLRETSSRNMARPHARSAGLLTLPEPQGATWLPESSSTMPKHPHIDMQHQGWMQVSGSCNQPSPALPSPGLVLHTQKF